VREAEEVERRRSLPVQGDDRVGAIADLLERLGAAKINVTAIDAVCADGRYGAIFWVAAKDVKKTAALLGCPVVVRSGARTSRGRAGGRAWRL
jgi:predicted amino acid-binding ACT domain protein